MELLVKFIFVFHFLLAVGICVFVLLQHGKGADLGAAFGSGASGSLFGAAGSANFLSRTTAILVTLFFITSIVLTYYSAQRSKISNEDGVMGNVPAPVTAPATTQPAAPQLPADVPSAPSATPNAAATAPADVPPAAAKEKAAPAEVPAVPKKADEKTSKTSPKP